jgi:hypothetical protein
MNIELGEIMCDRYPDWIVCSGWRPVTGFHKIIYRFP